MDWWPLPFIGNKRKSARVDASCSFAEGSRAKRQKRAFGIGEFYRPQGATVADIVFIHGLEGDRELTWTFDGADKPWPETLLPKELPDCRLLTFGYDATYIGQHGQVSMNRLRHHAMNLLNTVGQHRERDNTDDRPLFFVAHCLGGLVCKEALVKASNSQESRFQSISKATRGVAFLGTPHRGCDVDPWLEALAFSLQDHQTLNMNRDITEVLRPDSEVLFLIESDFASMIRGKQELRFCCFVAEKQHEQIGMPVPSHSGIMPDRNYMTIASDHFGMTKFEDERDSGFLKVSGELRQWLKHVRMTLPSEKLSTKSDEAKHTPSISEDRVRTILDSLRFDQMDARLMTIKNAHAKTCKWILQTKEYRDWLDETRLQDHLGFLWIKAKAGAGKSTAMKFLLKQAQTRKSAPRGTVISFFFNARGETLEKSVLGMYRHILFQLLESRAETRHILGVYNAVGDLDNYQWTVEALRDLLEQAILSLGPDPVLCYVDALDECDENEIRDMIELFENIAQAAIPKGVKFRFCFASRLYPRITMNRNIDLHLVGHEGHEQDIANYIQSNLAIGKSKLAENIRARVKEKASGVFMWVVLVVRMLKEAYDKGNIHALRERLDKIPPKLHELFEDILTRDNESMDAMLLSIQWVLFAETPLSPEELYYAMLSGLPDHNRGIRWQWDPTETTLDTMRNFILTSSKGLAEVTKSRQPKVQFIHESVRDFLLKDNGLSKIWREQVDTFEGRSHDQLKRCCQQYLNIDIFSELSIPEGLPKPKSEDGKELRSKTSSTLPFMKYACQSLLYHADLAQQHGVDQRGFLDSFPLQQWIRTDNLLAQHEVRRHTSRASLLYILAEQNTAHLIKVHPSAADCLREEEGLERYGTPFFAAAATWNEAAQQAFIVAMAPLCDYSGLYFLWCRSRQEKNRLPTINERFSRKFEYKVHKNRDGSLWYFHHALTLAEEENGYLGKFLAAKLLQHNGANQDVHPDLFGRAFSEKKARELLNDSERHEQEHNWREPLVASPESSDQALVQWPSQKLSDSATQRFPIAVYENETSVIRFVLTLNLVDVNVRFSKLKAGTTALHMAAWMGHLDLVRLLLRKEDIQTNLMSAKGESPLTLAARNRHWSIVHLMINTPGVDVNKTRSGPSPLSYAAEHGKEDVVRALLDTGCVDIHYRDQSGRSPVLYAAESGHRQIVRLLLEAANMDADRVLLSPDGVLPELIRIQMQNGHFQMDARDRNNSTWLSRAARRGDFATVRFLVQLYPEVVDIPDIFGRTPLSYASSSGHADVVSVLLHTDKADVNSKDGSSRTPLIYAAQNGHLEVAHCLIDTGRVQINERDFFSHTALTSAAVGGHLNVVRLLLSTDDCEANLTAEKKFRNHHGQYLTLLDYMDQIIKGNGSEESKGKYGEIRKLLVDADRCQQHDNGQHHVPPLPHHIFGNYL